MLLCAVVLIKLSAREPFRKQTPIYVMLVAVVLVTLVSLVMLVAVVLIAVVLLAVKIVVLVAIVPIATVLQVSVVLVERCHLDDDVLLQVHVAGVGGGVGAAKRLVATSVGRCTAALAPHRRLGCSQAPAPSGAPGSGRAQRRRLPGAEGGPP